MRRAIWIVLALAIGGFLYMGASHAQPQDPFFLVQTPQGVNITAGRNVPSLATTGNPPSDGSLHITTVAGGAPSLGLYDDSTQTWIGFLGTAGTLTNDFIPVWDSVGGGFEDSLISTDGTDTTFNSGDAFFGVEGTTLSIAITGGTIVFEGPGVDDFEFTLNPPDATADVVASFPDFTGTVMLGTIADNTIPFYNLATGNFVDSLLTDDGTNITLASGQVLLPDGLVGAPALSFASDATTGLYIAGANMYGVVSGAISWRATNAQFRFTPGTVAAPGLSPTNDADSGIYGIAADNLGMSVGGALVMDWEDTNAAGAGADLVTISSTLGIMDDNADIFRGLSVDLTNAVHTAAVTAPFVYGIDVDDIVASAATEIGINIQDGWDTDINFVNAAAGIEFPSVLTIREDGGGVQFITRGSLGFTQSYAEVTVSPLNMNGGDELNAFNIDVANSNPTGATNTLNLFSIDPVVGDANMNLNGISVGAMTSSTGAAGEIEAAVHLDASWDYALFVDGTTQDIDHGITTAVMLAPTLAANDNASDQRNVLLIDVDIPNGSAGLVNGINIDGVTDDANTIDSAIFVEAGWDSALTMTDINRTATANPLTGTVWMYLTDATDHDGGGNDCAVVFRDAAGAEAGYIIIVNNGVCP